MVLNVMSLHLIFFASSQKELTFSKLKVLPIAILLLEKIQLKKVFRMPPYKKLEDSVTLQFLYHKPQDY